MAASAAASAVAVTLAANTTTHAAVDVDLSTGTETLIFAATPFLNFGVDDNGNLAAARDGVNAHFLVVPAGETRVFLAPKELDQTCVTAQDATLGLEKCDTDKAEQVFVLETDSQSGDGGPVTIVAANGKRVVVSDEGAISLETVDPAGACRFNFVTGLDTGDATS